MKFILKHLGKVIAETQLEEGKEYLVGRHKDCDFILQEETGLSRNHIKIHQSTETGNWIIESISELGGLYLEGEEVDGVEIEETSLLTLKNYVFEFVKETPKEELPQNSQQITPELNPDLENQQEEFDTSGGTKILSDTDLIYSLNVYIHGEISEHISLNEGDNWTIGRSEECDISIDYSVLTRKHLQISKKDGQFYLTDLGGANQTFLNDTELIPHKSVPLKPNDEIFISDLSIIFEVRNKAIEQMMGHLPDVVSEEPKDGENLPSVAMSKVVLEEIPPEEVTARKPSFLQPRMIIFVIVLLVLAGGGLYFKHNLEKKKNQALLEQQLKNKEYKNKLEAFYQEALTHKEQGKYQLCINQIEELHQISADGHYRDSKQILLQCHNAVELQRQKEEYLAQEEKRKQNEEQIQKIVEKCQSEFKKNIIQTEADLDDCARELLEALDPTNANISAIRMEIRERENIKRMEEEKRQSYRAFIRGKKALYNKAKKLKEKSPITETPKVIRAYDRFLKAAKNISDLKALYKQAETEKDSLQEKYDNELARLHSSCESLIKDTAFKKAYYNCREILGFKKDDEKAKEYMKMARLSLQKSFKLKYEKSMSEETFARIEEAKKIWKEILEQDIKEGIYYRKALSQLKKYK